MEKRLKQSIFNNQELIFSDCVTDITIGRNDDF